MKSNIPRNSKRGILTQQEVVDLGLWPSVGRLNHRARHFLGGTEVKGRHILEVGCGNGAFLVWCWANGAKRCVGIEPETDGSKSGTSNIFENAIQRLGCSQEVQLLRIRLEELFTNNVGSFDVVLLYNVINHLDENACERLKEDQAAREVYVNAFRNLGRLVQGHGKVIIADCARNNLFPDLGFRNPFAPNIEWSKHQNPDVWKAILNAAGFIPGASRWYQLYPLRHLGFLFSNRLIAYLTYSHFVLEFAKE